MASAQNKSSRNGSSRPGAPARKNTLQKMLDLEKRNKIERMRASLPPETQQPYRTTYHQATPSLAPITSQQRRQTFNPRQTQAVPLSSLNQEIAPTIQHSMTMPAGFSTISNPNVQQTFQQRNYSNQQSNSEDKPMHSKNQKRIIAELPETTTRSLSLSSFEKQQNYHNTVTDNPGFKPQSQEEPDSSTGQLYQNSKPTGKSTHYSSQPLSLDSMQPNMHVETTGARLANAMSASRNLPTSLSVKKPKEQPIQEMIPQLDGTSDSKPARSGEVSVPQAVNESSAIDPGSHEARPQTPPLQRTESNRSSICRSPAWSVTHGERGRRMEEEKKAKKKAAKEAEHLRQKELKAAKERQEKEAKEAKAAREKQEKEEKAIREKEEKEREKQEKEQRAIREKEEREREKEAKATKKQEKKLSKPQSSVPRKLQKGDRSTSMPVVPSTLTSRLTPGSRLSSFQSTDGLNDSNNTRKSFQTKPALPAPDEGFIGGLKLERARKAAMGHILGEKKDVVEPVIAAPRRFGLDDDSDDEKDDEEFEKDMVRNAYHTALNDSSKPCPPEPVMPKSSRRQTVGEAPPSDKLKSQETVVFLPKHKSPFYQNSPANNSFVDEIFNTIQKRHSRSSSTNSQLHPLRSNPSMDATRSDGMVPSEGNQSEKATTGAKNDEPQLTGKEPIYSSSSFAARMAKKSGSFGEMPTEVKAQEVHDVPAITVEQHQIYGSHEYPPGKSNPSGESLRVGRLAAAFGADSLTVAVQNGNRHQVTVLEGIKTKSHSMLIEKLTIADDQGEDDDQDDEKTPVVADTKKDITKKGDSRSSSRESWFRRSSKDESKLTIQERRRSKGSKRDSVSSVQSIPVISNENSSQTTKDVRLEKPRFGRRNSISPTINSFKAAAKAAFSKYGPAAPSSKANLPSSALNRPGSSDGAVPVVPRDIRRQTLPSSVTMPSMAKADKILGENLSSVTIADWRKSAEHLYDSKSSSVRTKASDEEASSPEDGQDLSNITTPTASRPASKKDQFLTLDSPSSLLSGRFREEFSPDFLSALERGTFETSPLEPAIFEASPVEEVSSIVPTPVASPTKESNVEEDGSLIADAIARVAEFSLPKKFETQYKEEGATVDERENKGKHVSEKEVEDLRSSDAPVYSINVLRQKSVKSSSTSNLPSLTKTDSSTGSAKTQPPEIDFSFLPPLKHEPLVKPSRASASPSLQAIAASLLGPPSSKPKPNATTTSSRVGSPLASPSSASTLPLTTKQSTAPLPSQAPLQPTKPTPTSPNSAPTTIKTRASSQPASQTRRLLDQHAKPNQAQHTPPSPNHAPSTPPPEIRNLSSRPTSLPPSSLKNADRFSKSGNTSTNSHSEEISEDKIIAKSIKRNWLKAISGEIEEEDGRGLEDGRDEDEGGEEGGKVGGEGVERRGGEGSESLFGEGKEGLSSMGSKQQQLSIQRPQQLRTQKSFQLHSDLIKHPTGGSLEDPFAKCFLVCCSCKRFHDLPVDVYERLLSGSSSRITDLDGGSGSGSQLIKGKGVSVKCQWCQHGMTTTCCENWAICVKLVERLS